MNRRSRALAVITLVWALPWSLFGLGVISWHTARGTVDLGFLAFVLIPLFYGVLGAIMGLGFGLALALFERGKSIVRVRLAPAAATAAAVAYGATALMEFDHNEPVQFAVLAAICAALTLLVARRNRSMESAEAAT